MSNSLKNYSIPDYKELQTPCYIFDEMEFERSVNEFKKALDLNCKKSIIGYSVKTNSLPYCLIEAKKNGCYAEVVSHDEYQLARLCGFEPDRIIYNGPMKAKASFLEAVKGGAVVNIETKRELDWLNDLPSDQIFTVGIRLNINISKISPEDADGDDDNSRFGFSDESDEFRDALESLANLSNVTLSGLHIHRTAHSRSPRFYECSVAYAASVINKYNLNLKYLDVGGGYFGIFPNKPTFTDYTEAIYRPLKRTGLENLDIIIEPGNALTASCFKFISEVIDVKRVDSKTRFVTTDGSRNDVDPFFRKSDYLKDILYLNENRPIEYLQIVGGCTCLEYDRLFSLIEKPALMPGDRILYNNVGAYTLTLTPQFIRFWPRVYTLDKQGKLAEIRRPSEASDLFSTQTYK
ncbi:MAG: diaminopimelate decarboxylase [Muribaculaceae bacterium]|nr:diaminopimelate decarboxylase [Muribaculaceae bacterium]